MDNVIKIFTINGCHYCADLKNKLNENNINFIEINILDDKHKTEINEILNVSHSDEVPIIRINKTLLVPNKSFKTIDESVDIIKKMIDDK